MFQPATPPRDRGPSQEWTTTYVKSIDGILKIAEILLSLIGFICAVTYPYQWYGGIGWTVFVCITGFLISLASFVLRILNYFPDHMTVHLIHLIVYAAWTVFFLIAGIVAAVVASRVSNYAASPGAAAFFCFACLVVWAIDTVIQFMGWNNKRNESTSAGSGPPPTTAASDAPTY